jgi:hypothetical protein
MNISLLHKLIAIATVLFFTHSCKKHQSIYGFDISNCRVESEIDGETHFIQLSCDKWDVQIDYGFGVYSYHESNSPEDYLRNEKWKLFAIPELKMDRDDDVNLYAIVDSSLTFGPILSQYLILKKKLNLLLLFRRSLFMYTPSMFLLPTSAPRHFLQFPKPPVDAVLGKFFT